MEITSCETDAQHVCTPSFKNDLIHEYLSFADEMSWKVIRKFRIDKIYFEELKSAAMYGLVEAAQRYDPKICDNFKVFAQFRVRGAIIDHIRASFLIKGKAYKLAKAHKYAQDIYEHSINSDAKEASAVTTVRLVNVAKAVALSIRLSLLEMEELPEDFEKNSNPEDRLIRQQRTKIVFNAIRLLPRREREIIEHYYFNDRSLTDISQTSDKVSRSWLSRIHTRALMRLKKYLSMSSAEFSESEDEEE